MAERELAIVIRARDLASKGIRGVKKELGGLGSAGAKAMNGLSTAIKRVGIASAVGLVGAVGLGVRSLGHLERVTNQTNAVLESTRGASGQTADAIREHAEALEQLTTADDKAIQEGQNLLLTFTKIGGKTFPMATEAVTNMAIAMAKGDVANADFKGTALQVGKALNNPIKGITALTRAGVSFTEQQKKQITALVKAGKVEEAQAVILKELAVEFGNAGKAAGTGFEADMRRVEDAGGSATQALARGVMPALGRFAKFLSTKLADPAVIKAIDELGKGLGDAAMSAIDFIETVDFKAIGAGLKTAKDAAAGIVGAFMAMPDWVKQAIVTGWGLNKLSGGALSGLLGGVIKGVLGMTAGVVNIKAGVVNGAGGLPGAGGPGGKGGGIPGAVAALPIAGLIVGAAVPIGEAFADALPPGLKGLDGKGMSESQTRITAALAQVAANTAPVQSAGDKITTAVETMRGNLGGLINRSAEKQASTTRAAGVTSAVAARLAGEKTYTAARTAGITSALAAKNAGDRTAAAARTAGVVAKSGGISAAIAIRNKRWRINTQFTANISTRISVRDQVQAFYKVGRYGRIAEFG